VGGLRERLQRQFKLQVADWQDTCRELAGWEDRNLVEGSSPEKLAEHAVLIDELEQVGRWLTATANQPGFPDKATTEQIGRTLRDLQDARAMWHGQIQEDLRREILRDCFHES